MLKEGGGHVSKAMRDELCHYQIDRVVSCTVQLPEMLAAVQPRHIGNECAYKHVVEKENNKIKKHVRFADPANVNSNSKNLHTSVCRAKTNGKKLRQSVSQHFFI